VRRFREDGALGWLGTCKDCEAALGIVPKWNLTYSAMKRMSGELVSRLLPEEALAVMTEVQLCIKIASCIELPGG